MQLSGKTALVTGGSRGIGRAAAIGLAKAGANVAINYHSQAEAAESAAEEIRQLGRKALTLKADVSDYEAVEDMAAKTVAQFGRLDIAVSNAVYSDRQPFHEADLRGFRRTIDVSMWGAFHLLRAATRQMISQGGGGAIVIVSSPHSIIPIPDAMAYNMAKAAIDQMARTAAIELVGQRIRVNILHPGWTDTPGERKFFSEETLSKAAQRLPWGRLGTAEEVARGVVFLADPASDYITGTTLSIDGGITLPWWSSRGGGVPE